MAVPIPQMQWLVPDAGGVDANTTARVYHDILHATALPRLRSVVPLLPWLAGPTADSCILSYAPQASVMWAAAKLEDDSDADATIAANLLGPGRFFSESKGWNDATFRLKTCVANKDGTEFYTVHADSEQIAPGPVTGNNAIPTELRYTSEIKLRQYATEYNESLWPMTSFEIATAPRNPVNLRRDATKPYLRTCLQLDRQLRSHGADVKAMMAAEETEATIRL